MGPWLSWLVVVVGLECINTNRDAALLRSGGQRHGCAASFKTLYDEYELRSMESCSATPQSSG